MSLTKNDLKQIEALLDNQIKDLFVEQGKLFDQKLNKQKKEIMIDVFQNFATKKEVEEIVEQKLVPIQMQLGTIQEIVIRFDNYLNTEKVIMDKFGIESRRRIVRLEKKVGIDSEELPKI